MSWSSLLSTPEESFAADERTFDRPEIDRGRLFVEEEAILAGSADSGGDPLKALSTLAWIDAQAIDRHKGEHRP
jgi:hypothetical protein